MKRKRRQGYTPVRMAINRTTILKRHPWMKYPIWTFSILFGLGAVSIFILSRNLPSLEELERAGDPDLVSRIYSADGVVLKELYEERRIKVLLDCKSREDNFTCFVN